MSHKSLYVEGKSYQCPDCGLITNKPTLVNNHLGRIAVWPRCIELLDQGDIIGIEDWRDELFAIDSLSEQVDWCIEEIEHLRAELRIREDWMKEVSALNLKWAKVWSQCKHGGAA